MRILQRLKDRNFLLLLLGDSTLVVSSFLFSILIRFDFDIPLSVSLLFNAKFISFLILSKIFCYRLFGFIQGHVEVYKRLGYV